MSTPPATITSYATTFRENLEFTRAVRYRANSRLRRKHILSLYTTSILSIYVLGATIYPLFFPEKSNSLLAILAIIASVLIIVITLIEAERNYKTDAELLLKCARRMTILMQQLDLAIANGVTQIEVEKLQQDYHTILTEFGVNHGDVDYKYERCSRAYEDLSKSKANKADHKAVKLFAWSKKAKATIALWWDIYWFYLLLTFIPLLILGWLLS